ncbi:hypothetical protein ABVK25_003541 [Lepraria finkii]|uniref:Enoyl reductase (ER) domain-containing protein n=1 Tax=Lepraria finkii TaxID=1340010 RepID=A0ABR4BDH9_9LECA
MPTTPHPITKEQVPLTLGHEFSGTIEEVGEDVHDIKVGTRVTVQPIIYDGTCGACKEGYINCCDGNGFVGLSGWGGGLSEHVVVPRDAVYEVPEKVSLEVAALVEPIAVAWHAINISPFKKGDSVLILGGGPIGLAVIQCLKAKGAGKILVSEMASRRKEFARRFGADYVLDPSKDDIVARVRETCDGQGANVAFDAAGVQAGLDQAIQAIRARGTLVNIAIWEKTATISPNWLCFRERKYMGVATYQAGDFQDVLDAISSGQLKPESMITKKIQMNEVEEQGFKTLIHDKDNHVKILVEISP